MDPDASSKATSLSGLILRRRNLRSSGSPPWATLSRIVARKSSRRPRRRTRSRRVSRVRITRAKRSASSAARARSLSPTNAAMSFLDIASCADAPSCRPPPSAGASSGAPPSPIWVGSCRWSSAPGSCWKRRGERAASASALIFTALFTPRPRQNASNNSSNRASSVRREANRVRIAARRRSRRSAIGLDSSRAASCVSAWPMTKPASRKVTTNPARRLRIAGPGPGPSTAKPSAPITRRLSCDPAQEPARRLRADRGAVLSGLQERDQRCVHDLRVVMEILDLEAGEGGRPIERFRDAWNLLQLFLAQHSDHARDLKGKIRVEAGLAVEQDRRLAIDVRKIEIVIKAAAAQSVRQFARGVGGQHDPRDRKRRNRAEFGNRDLKVRQKFEQERLEFLIRTVDFVDQQHWRRLLPDGFEQRPLKQIVLGEDLRFDLGGA